MMSDFKVYVLSVIITSVVLQTGNLFLKDTKYNKFYANISSLVMMAVLFFSLFSLPKISFDNVSLNEIKDFSDSEIKTVFSKNLEQKIKDDIIEIGGEECEVSVTTDLHALKIDIQSDLDENIKNELKKYVEKKYCTTKDVVTVSGYY